MSTQEEIIEMADKADEEADNVLNMKGEYHPNWHQVRDEIFAKLVEDKVTARYMQLFLDPENQPTQFGTATQEYREQEIKKMQERIDKLHNMYELVCKQRDELMDQQRAMVAAMRGQLQ